MKIPVEHYILGLTHLVREAIGEEGEERLSVLVDCRPGRKGMPNPRGDQMFPVIIAVNSLLASHFPERCERCVLYPLPAILKGLWKGVSKLLDERARNIIKVVANQWGRDLPLGLNQYVNLSNFEGDGLEDAWERHRDKGKGGLD
jgi:hypothetical protein